MKQNAIERTKTAIIVFLALILLVLIYFILNAGAASSPFRVPVKNKEARETIKKYRDMWSGSLHKKTQGVIYDSATIYHYIVDTFPKVKSKLLRLDSLKDKGYDLAVGFYFMRKDNSEGKPRNSFYVIPTFMRVIDKDTSVLDFFDNPKMYEHKKPNKGNDDDENSYDAGHLWP